MNLSNAFARVASALALLLACSAVQAQYWPARRMVAEVRTAIIVGKDKNGQEIDRFEKAWVERAITVLDKLAPIYEIQTPPLFITKDSGPNAFVTIEKGGEPIMVINTDMLRLAGNNDSMMAAVIGHELGHLKAEHVTKGANTAAAISFIGALLGAAVDINQAKQGHDTYGLGSAIGEVGSGLVNAKFSRDQEREADELGARAMARAGYDPSATARLWRLMAQRGGSSGLWMDSHPSHAEREQAMVTLARSLDPVYAANKPVVTALPVYPDPYPTPRYTNFDPTSYEVASQTAYQRGRVAYQAKQFTNAYPLLNEAAMLGDERAMTLLGGMAQNGQGGQVIDLGRARLYYESAAAKGFGPAIGTLGLMSLTGKGTSKNAAEAARLFVLADSRNYLRATAMLGMMHLDGNVFGKNAEMGRQFAERAASGGDALGRALFGTLLRDGIGGPNDPVKGFSLISQAAPNLSWASYQLGISYEKGAGTAVDKEKAIAAYRSAANGGIAAAESRLQMLTSK